MALPLRFGGLSCGRRREPVYTVPMPNVDYIRPALRAALPLAIFLSMPVAWAQWQWVDNTGRKVFSDTAPPATVPEKNILKRPGNVPPLSAPAAEGASPAAPVAAAAPAPGLPAPSKADAELDARKKQAEAAEEAKKKAEAERVARARADNCDRAKRNKATLDSGSRVAVVNAKGEREFLDDNRRAAETQRLDQIIRSDCGPLPQ